MSNYLHPCKPATPFSNKIKVYPVGPRAHASIRGMRLNVQPCEMKAEPLARNRDWRWRE